MRDNEFSMDLPIGRRGYYLDLKKEALELIAPAKAEGIYLAQSAASLV
jgi:hypothetical protein